VGHAVRAARARWSQRVEELLSVELIGGQPSAEQVAEARQRARGLFALQAHEAVAHLPVEDQCHPDAQALQRDAAEALGGGSGRAAERAVADLQDDPEALRGAVRRSVRRMQRVEARATRMVAAPGAVHHDLDDDTKRRIALGRARHQPTGVVGGVLGFIGVVLLCLVVIGGLLIAALGLLLNLALGLGIVLLVVGLGLVVLAVIGIVALVGG
jgi:hypothetical protein